MDQLTAEYGGARRVGTGVGPVLEKFNGIRRIAVLRGGGLGDLMFALPAVSALAAAYPEAEITLLGTPVHQELLAVTDSPVSRVEILPHAEGVRPGIEDRAAVDAFFTRTQGMGLDLAVQLHGGGRYSNPFLLRLGARHTVGTRTPDAAHLERSIPYLYYQHEPLRALEVAGFAGAYPRDLEARLVPSRHPDYHTRTDDGGGEPLVVIHPGATDPRTHGAGGRPHGSLTLRGRAPPKGSGLPWWGTGVSSHWRRRSLRRPVPAASAPWRGSWTWQSSSQCWPQRQWL